MKDQMAGLEFYDYREVLEAEHEMGQPFQADLEFVLGL